MALNYYYGTKYSCADCGTPLELDVVVAFDSAIVVLINKNYISTTTGYNYRITGEASFDEFADVLDGTPYDNCSQACFGTTTTTTSAPPDTTTTTTLAPTTTTTTLAPAWYRTTSCTDGSTVYTNQRTVGTFAINDRLTFGGTFFVVQQELTSNPGGTQLSMTGTGFTGCPAIPTTTTTTTAPATTTTTTTVAPPPPTTTTTTLPVVVFTYSDSCAGGAGTGIITITNISGGTGTGYQYSIQPTPGIWYNYPATNQLTGLANGTYTVAVRDSAGNGTSTPGIPISCVTPNTTTSTTTLGPPQFDYYYADQYECPNCSTPLQIDTIVKFDVGTQVLANRNYLDISGNYNYRIKGDASFDQFAPLMQTVAYNNCESICNPPTTTTTTTGGPTTTSTTTFGPTTTTTQGPTTTTTTTLYIPYDYYFATKYSCTDCNNPIEYDVVVKFPQGSSVILNNHYVSNISGYNYRITGDASYDFLAETLELTAYNTCALACFGPTTSTTTEGPTTTTTTSGPTTTTTSGPTTTTTSGPTTTTTLGPTTTTTLGPTTTSTTTLSVTYNYYYSTKYSCIDCGAPIEYDVIVKIPSTANVIFNRHYISNYSGYNYRITGEASYDFTADTLGVIAYSTCALACVGPTTTTTTLGPTTTTTLGPTTTTTSGPTTTTTSGPTTTTTLGPTTTTTLGPTTTTTLRPTTSTTTTTTLPPGYVYTITYSPDQNGWTSFHSYRPEWMVSMNNGFYSFKNGNLYRHYVNSTRNSYYGIVYPSSITTVFNNDPTQTKKFKTIATNSTIAWDTIVSSDQGSGSMKAELYDLKEGTFYTYIRRNANDNNLSMTSAQGVGNLLSINGNTLVFDFNVGSIISDGDLAYWVNPSNALVLAGTISSHDNNTITLSNVGTLPSAGNFILYIKNSIAESTPTKGTYLEVNLTSTSEEYSEIVSVSSEVFKSFS